MRGAIPYPFPRSRKNRSLDTYGMRGRFGGWLFERNHRAVRLRMRRQWRSQARQAARKWLSTQKEETLV